MPAATAFYISTCPEAFPTETVATMLYYTFYLHGLLDFFGVLLLCYQDFFLLVVLLC